MRFLIFILLFMPYMAFANIASTSYVQKQIADQIATAVANKADIRALESKVDTAASANQTMAGSYTVSGTLNLTGVATVETPPLPSAE